MKKVILGGLLVLGIVLWVSSAHIVGKGVGSVLLLWIILWMFPQEDIGD